MYDGHALCRLLDQRWSGHLNVTKIIFNNLTKIIPTLEKVTTYSNMNGDNIAEATGLLAIMKTEEFRFSLIFLKQILETTEPADKICQIRKSS